MTMNHARRDELAKLQIALQAFWVDSRDKIETMMVTAGEIREGIEEIQCEEKAAFGALNTGLQAAGRGRQMEVAIESLESICAELDRVVIDMFDVNNNFDAAMR